MQKYQDMEAQRIQAMKKPEKQYVTCTVCGSQYFEQARAQKFDANQSIALGQSLTPAETQVFLRCVRCSETYEPLVNYQMSTPEGKQYDTFRDLMEGKDDLRKKDKV